MKEKLTLRNLLVWGGALLAIVAFFVAFAAGISHSESGVSVNIKGLIIGTQKAVMTAGGATMESVESDPARAVGSLIGIILALLAGICAVVCSFVLKAEKAKKVIIVCGLVMVVAAVLVLLCKVFYVQACISKANAEGAAADAIKEALKPYSLNAATVIVAVMYILGGGAMVAGELVAKK